MVRLVENVTNTNIYWRNSRTRIFLWRNPGGANQSGVFHGGVPSQCGGVIRTVNCLALQHDLLEIVAADDELLYC